MRNRPTFFDFLRSAFWQERGHDSTNRVEVTDSKRRAETASTMMNQPCFIELLGGLRVRQGDRVIARFRTQKTAALLVYLAYFWKRSHPREELIELLWPDTAPEDGRASLRTALSSLRHQLEPPGMPYNSVLIADRTNVRLNPDAVITDVERFESSVQAAACIAEIPQRVQALMQALELYRGPLLPGFYEDWALRERERLEQVYLSASGQLMELLAQQDELGQAIEYALRRVHAEPLMEEARCDLIRLYIATGQLDAARDQYREMERLLREELKTTLSPETQALAAQLTDNRRSETQTHSMTLPSSLAHATASAPVPLPSPPKPFLSPRLPLHLTAFFGREDELARLQALLTPLRAGSPTREHSDNDTPTYQHALPPRLLTLTGPGGAGKTRLAVEVARKLIEAYGGRVWFVPLADVTDAEQIPDALLSVLRLPRSANQEPLEQLAQALDQHPSLLILDNFEQLAETGTPFVWTLLERIRTLICLLTSRQRLDLTGEREFPVQPLPVPTMPTAPERLIEFASVRLFVDRAQAARADFQVTQENAEAVAALCERLEGIPLAIELAAAWAQALTPSQMLARLARRFEFLASRRKDLSARQRTLRATIEWSYRLLTPEQQRFFVRLSVFRGGWTLAAAEAICTEPLDYLRQLQERSLLVTEEANSEMRFRLLEALREYAWDRLSEVGEDEAVCNSHRDYFLALVEAARPKMQGPEQAVTLEAIEVEHDNLRAALQFSVKELTYRDDLPNRSFASDAWSSSPDVQRAAELGLRLAVALAPFWEVRGYLSEGRKWLEALLAGSGDAAVSWRAKALEAAGRLAWQQASYLSARTLFEESLALFRQSGDVQGIADTLHDLGILAEEQGDYVAARAFLEESLEIKRRLGDQRGIAASLNSLANVVTDQGEYACARPLYEESLGLRRALEDQRGVASVLTNLGLMLYEQADYATARALHTESLALYRALGDRRGITASLSNLAIVAQEQGDSVEARALHEESLAMRRELGDQRGIAISLNNLGDLARREGNITSASALYHEGLALRRQLGDKRGVASSLAHLGNLAAVQGDSVSARSLYLESLTIRWELEDKRGIAECLEKFAGLIAARQPQRAARFFGAAESLRETIDTPLPPTEQAAYDRDVMAVRAGLSEADFKEVWQEGRALPLEEALAYALEDEEVIAP